MPLGAGIPGAAALRSPERQRASAGAGSPRPGCASLLPKVTARPPGPRRRHPFPGGAVRDRAAPRSPPQPRGGRSPAGVPVLPAPPPPDAPRPGSLAALPPPAAASPEVAGQGAAAAPHGHGERRRGPEMRLRGTRHAGSRSFSCRRSTGARAARSLLLAHMRHRVTRGRRSRRQHRRGGGTSSVSRGGEERSGGERSGGGSAASSCRRCRGPAPPLRQEDAGCGLRAAGCAASPGEGRAPRPGTAAGLGGGGAAARGSSAAREGLPFLRDSHRPAGPPREAPGPQCPAVPPQEQQPSHGAAGFS